MPPSRIVFVRKARNDDVLRFLARIEVKTVEGRRRIATQLGTNEIQMKMHEYEGGRRSAPDVA